MWKYDISQNNWQYLSGNRSRNIRTDYSVPFPGSIYLHSMVIDSKENFLYIFGGLGYNDTTYGIFLQFLLIN